MTRRQRALRDPLEDESRLGGVLGALGGLVAAHPSLAGGGAAFAVIFSFVSANALWYQPGNHPAPILETREVPRNPAPEASQVIKTDREIIEGVIRDVPAKKVTTYRIERSDGTATASIPVPSSAPPARAPAASDRLLIEIQARLFSKGLYSGEIDGLMGPMSASAIRAWEKRAGLEETGTPSERLLAAIDAESTPSAARPQPRPEPVVATDARNAGPVTLPADVADLSELVRKIQSGLSNIAYADITVDGVVGSQTRAAIRAFEKHYRLTETGEPNEDVLNKLMEIGAL